MIGLRNEMSTCPICGEECNVLYSDKSGDIFACDRCVKEESAEERLERDKFDALADRYDRYKKGR